MLVMSIPSMLSIVEYQHTLGTQASQHNTNMICPPLGSTIRKRDMARVDFPDPVLPT